MKRVYKILMLTITVVMAFIMSTSAIAKTEQYTYSGKKYTITATLDNNLHRTIHTIVGPSGTSPTGSGTVTYDVLGITYYNQPVYGNTVGNVWSVYNSFANSNVNITKATTTFHAKTVTSTLDNL